ncbi:hypothetical protein MBLNU230_g2476t1 [Neophaeotheca triangularis]
MDQLPALGKSIMDIVMPTFQTYRPLLEKNAETIRSVKKETFTYGPHPRHQLDIYSPPKPALINGRRPVLMFFYGGGLVNGARTLPPFGDLVHANVGAFFALQFGYTVAVVDYRLMSHGAKFPSGGEDVALATEWLGNNAGNVGSEPIDLFIVGNSAGGMHLSTFLLHDRFADTRDMLCTGGRGGVRLRGVVLLSVPFHFELANKDRFEVLGRYYDDIASESPLGLLKSARKRSEPLGFVKSGVRVFVLDAELEPENEILQPNQDFVQEWLQMSDPDSHLALAYDKMIGHNHISPPCALGTGIEREEAWGHQLASFCDNIRKFEPRNA